MTLRTQSSSDLYHHQERKCICTSGGELKLPAKNYLIPVDGAGTYCLAFAATGGAVSIVGNVQQQGIRVSFDTAKNTVGFSPNKC